MDLLLWIAGAAVLLLLLVLAAGYRRRGTSDGPRREPSDGAPAHGSPSTNHGTFGSGGAV